MFQRRSIAEMQSKTPGALDEPPAGRLVALAMFRSCFDVIHFRCTVLTAIKH
jgi:hypothetical protein